MFLKTQIPLLKDSHNHPFLYASLQNCVDLRLIKYKAAAISAIKRTDEDMTVAIGWNDSLYSFDQKEIDQLAPTVIVNTSLHRYMLNKQAIDKLEDTHKHIIKYVNDNEWIEKHFPKVLNFIMSLRPCSKENLKAFYAYLLNQGVWCAAEMSLRDENEIELFVNSQLHDRTRFWADIETFLKLDEGYRRYVYGIKMYSDGALGAKSAKLKKPYLNGTNGLLIYTDKELLAQIERVLELKKPIAIHAIGDKAIEQVINTLDTVQKEKGIIPKIRIEHCQFISKTEAEKAKSLGITLSMQPNFSIESDTYKDRLSDKYCACNNPFRMLIDEVGFIPGEDLIFGSDGMPHGAKNALKASLFPPLPGQALTLDEFVAGYCMPDKRHGHIEIQIDEKNGLVSTDTVLKNGYFHTRM